MKHYLIDSENVGDFWIPLLELPADQAELIVFYTKNSPHMSYDSLIKLKESDRKVTFIKCYEGTNALDFQLCSELGFLIAVNPGDEFIIVTNDTGYDAAVKYWRRKEYSVKRIAGKDSRTGSRRRGTTAKSDVASEVSAILHKLVRMPEHEESDLQEEQAEEERMETASEDQMTPETEPEEEYGEEPADGDTEDYEEEADPLEDYDEEEPEDPAEEFSEEELSEEEQSEGAQEDLPEEDNTGEIGEDSEKELEEEPAEPVEDAAADDEDVYPSVASETFEVRETESGTLKEEEAEIESESSEEIFLYYCALIFRHSDVPAEELSEENISEFAQFLLGAENKRKNLNSLRYALLKHYGKEKGRRYYFMLKPYVKALNQM